MFYTLKVTINVRSILTCKSARQFKSSLNQGQAISKSIGIMLLASGVATFHWGFLALRRKDKKSATPRGRQDITNLIVNDTVIAYR